MACAGGTPQCAMTVTPHAGSFLWHVGIPCAAFVWQQAARCRHDVNRSCPVTNADHDPVCCVLSLQHASEGTLLGGAAAGADADKLDTGGVSKVRWFWSVDCATVAACGLVSTSSWAAFVTHQLACTQRLQCACSTNQWYPRPAALPHLLFGCSHLPSGRGTS